MLGCLLLLLACVNLSFTVINTPLPCERRDAQGYDNVPNNIDFHDWGVLSGPSSPDGMTGPPNGQRNMSGDCYFAQTSPGDAKGQNAVLFSPCYNMSTDHNDPPLLEFYHFTYGRDAGTLLVHVIEGCREAQDWQPADIPKITDFIWEVVGSQSNEWEQVNLILDVSTSNSFQEIFTTFINPQILFEAFTGNGSLGHIAVDDISVIGVTCHSEDNFFCDSSNCIPLSATCDEHRPGGSVDCIDGIDEAEDTCDCDPNMEFTCNNGRCIANALQCNGEKDCAQNEDEVDCSGTATMMSGTSAGTSADNRSTIPSLTLTDVVDIITNAVTSERTTNLQANTLQTETSMVPYTFCSNSDLVGSAMNNCSFIGIVVAAGILFIVFIIWLVAFTYNRCIPDERKHSTASAITSFTHDNVASVNESDTGHENPVALATVKTESETVVKDNDKQVATTTFGGDSNGTKENGIAEPKVAPESQLPDKDEDEEVTYDTAAAQMHGEVRSASLTATEESNKGDSKGVFGMSKKDNQEGVVLTGYKQRGSMIYTQPSGVAEIKEEKTADDKPNDEDVKSPNIGAMPRSQSIDSTGYSKIEINPSEKTEAPAMSPKSEESPAYEDVNLDETKPETRRPTLPTGHPTFANQASKKEAVKDEKPQIKEKPSMAVKPQIKDKPAKDHKSKKSANIIKPSGKLTAIAENLSSESPNVTAPPDPVYSKPDKSRNSKLGPEEDENVAALYDKPDKRKSSGYSKIADDMADLQAQEDAYNATYEDVNLGGAPKESEGRRPTLPNDHPSLRRNPATNPASERPSENENTPDSLPKTENMELEEPYAESAFVPPLSTGEEVGVEAKMPEKLQLTEDGTGSGSDKNGTGHVNGAPGKEGWVEYSIYASS